MAERDLTPLPDVRVRASLALAGGVVGVAVLIVAAAGWMIAMPGQARPSTAAESSAVDLALAARLRAHVTSLATTSTAALGQRSFHGGDLEDAEQVVTRAFRALGLEPTARTYELGGTRVANLEVTLPGRSRPEEVVLLGAHYDAVERTRGADDDASGVAVLLELARQLREAPLARTVRFVAFANEEPPHFQTEQMGSLVYARAARARHEAITAVLSLECLGYFSDAPGSQTYPAPFSALFPDRGDFVAVVGDLSSRSLVRRVVSELRGAAVLPSEGLAAPAFVPGIGWSDHWSFSLVGYPAVMVTDTALFRNPHYHQPTDTADTLDYARMARVVRGLEVVVRSLATDAT